MQRLIPNAKLIAILRNPVDRAYSDFLYRRKNGNEPSSDPLEAFRMEEERLERGWSPYFGYVEKGRYATHLETYFSTFPRSNLLVLLFDELREDVAAALRKTYAHLGIDTGFRADTTLRYSASGVPRSAVAQRAINAAKKSRSGRAVRRMLPAAQMHRWYSVVQNRNLAPAPPMPEPAREYLRTVYAPEIDRLELLLNRDLSAWR
jgi:hypothetical protein